MFPNTRDPEIALPQLLDVLLIPFNIALDFCLPEWGIGPWNVAALGATVPKAAVHKDRDSLSCENEIGVTWKCAVVHLPPADPSSNQCKPEAHFRGAIVTATNATEVLRRSGSDSGKNTARQILTKRPFHLAFRH